MQDQDELFAGVQLQNHLQLSRYGDWQVFAGYKRLERDSVLEPLC